MIRTKCIEGTSNDIHYCGSSAKFKAIPIYNRNEDARAITTLLSDPITNSNLLKHTPALETLTELY